MLYKFVRLVCLVALVLLRRMRVHGKDRVPVQGGILLVSNHSSYWDPVVIGCVLPVKRRVYFMAKEELFRIPVFGFILKKLGAFPVRRGGADRTAIRTALDYLGKKQVVGIFPEGTRNLKDEEMEYHLGAAMLAAKAAVPVLPVALEGTKGLFGRIKVVFGEPYLITEKGRLLGRKELTQASKRIMDEVNALKKTE